MDSLRDRFEKVQFKLGESDDAINQTLLNRAAGLKAEIIKKISDKEKRLAAAPESLPEDASIATVKRFAAKKDNTIEIYLPAGMDETSVRQLEGFRKLHGVCADPTVDMQVDLVRPATGQLSIVISLNKHYKLDLRGGFKLI